MKHIHAELIKQWADGAKIQRITATKDGYGWIDDNRPSWFGDVEYRIKPEEKKPVVRWLWAKQYAGEWGMLNVLLSEDEALQKFSGVFHKLDWSRTEFPE